MHQKDPAAKLADQPIVVNLVAAPTSLGDGTFQSLQHPVLVSLGLKFANEPGASVGQAFVVQVHRVLGDQNDSQTKGAGLFQQRQQRSLGRWFSRRWEEAKDLVEIEQRPKTGCACLATHPRQHVLQE